MDGAADAALQPCDPGDLLDFTSKYDFYPRHLRYDSADIKTMSMSIEYIDVNEQPVTLVNCEVDASDPDNLCLGFVCDGETDDDWLPDVYQFHFYDSTKSTAEVPQGT